MFEHGRDLAPTTATRHDAPAAKVGKSTLTEHLAAAPRREADATPPLFADPPEWEDLESESGDDSAALAALEANAPAAHDAPTEPEAHARAAAVEPTPTAPPSDAVAIAAASPNPHAAPFERSTKKKQKHDAKRDQYNRKVIEHHAGNDQQISRPGVRVGGKDEMHLKGDFAYRYQITSGTKATVVDKIWEHELQHGHEKSGARLALNPAHTRMLDIDGVHVECALSWQGGQSAAWIAISDLRGNTGAIKRAVNQHAKAGAPKAANQHARDTATPMMFRAVAGPADADRTDHGRYIVPGQKGLTGNLVSDYLAKSVIRRWTNDDVPHAHASAGSKRVEQAATKPLQAPTGKRDMINVMANLPHDRAAAVAVDVATPGDRFFVPRGATFRREISMYKRTKTTSNLRQTWVYGFIGKDQGGQQVADAHRRGWVPLRVLKSA